MTTGLFSMCAGCKVHAYPAAPDCFGAPSVASRNDGGGARSWGGRAEVDSSLRLPAVGKLRMTVGGCEQWSLRGRLMVRPAHHERELGARRERRRGAGGALPPLPTITPILTFPHQGGRDLCRGSLARSQVTLKKTEHSVPVLFLGDFRALAVAGFRHYPQLLWLLSSLQ